MRKLIEKMYGGLIKTKSDIITIKDYSNENKMLEYGFSPFSHYNKPKTLFYYWWDMLEIQSQVEDFDLDVFEVELLAFFNVHYGKRGKRVEAYYIGTKERVSDY